MCELKHNSQLLPHITTEFELKPFVGAFANGYLCRVKIFTSYLNAAFFCVTYISVDIKCGFLMHMPHGISHKQLIFSLSRKSCAVTHPKAIRAVQLLPSILNLN